MGMLIAEQVSYGDASGMLGEPVSWALFGGFAAGILIMVLASLVVGFIVTYLVQRAIVKYVTKLHLKYRSSAIDGSVHGSANDV